MSAINKMKGSNMDFKAKIEELNKERQAVFAEGLKKICGKIFKDNPEVKALRWRGYAPYFNDGEPCEFRIQGTDAEIEGSSPSDSDYGDEWTSLDWGDRPDWAKEFSSFVYSCEDLIKSVYGDNHEVTITNVDGAVQVVLDEYVDHE